MTETERSAAESPHPPETSEAFPGVEGEADPGLLREFAEFLRTNKKWWMAPIIVVILLLAVLIAFAASPAAPFIYTLF